MLQRWCQPTVRALDGYGASPFRVRTTCKDRIHGIFHARELHASSSKPVTPRAISVLHFTYGTRCIGGYHGGPYVQISTKGRPISPLDSIQSTQFIPQSSLAAFTALSDFISQKNISPNKLSLEALRAMYGFVKAQGQLHLFSPKQLTEIISLFGTLSLPDPRNGLIYLSKLAPHVITTSQDEEQWDFLIEVARDKQRTLKMKLNGTDGFWLMRALLTKVVLAEGETSLSPSDPRERALSEATQHYLRIWRHAHDIEIHLPLLQKWLDLGTQKDTVALVNRLCRVLEFHIYPNSRLIEVLWRLLLRRTLPLVPALRIRILTMVATRLSPHFARIQQEYDEKKRHKLASSPSDSSSALGTSELSNALGSALFPTYVPGSGPTSPEIRSWATEQARQAFAPAVTPDEQWGNLLLLAIHQSERLNAPSIAPPGSQEDADAVESETASETDESTAGDWRPVLMLNALERTTGCIGNSSGHSMTLAPDTKESVQDIVRPLWRTWKAEKNDSQSLNATASRPIAAAFFRLAAKVVDGPLTDACYRFCVQHDLFGRKERLAAEAAASWADLNAAYVLAVAACRRVGWRVAFEETQVSSKRDEVLTTLFHHYVLTDLLVARQVYRYAEESGYQLRERPILMMGLALATPQTWHLAVPLLEHPGMSKKRTEELLIAILRVFQSERRQYVDPALAKTLGDTLWTLYEHTPPANRFKYPIRFFFSIMIASGHPAQAISIVEAIHRNAPSTFFTTRLFLRLMRTLVRYRHFQLTHRVHRLVSTDPANAEAAADFRRKLTLSLARAGAHRAARVAYAHGVPSAEVKVRRSPREAMARAVKFNTRSPSAFHSLSITTILKRAPTSPPTIQYAATLLVRAHRISSARKVLQRSIPFLDRKTVTAIGNTILDGLLTMHLLRNGRLVRHLLHTRELLEKDYGFKPDRITINITIKALLRWRTVLDSSKVRGLFDHMVRCGYPVSEQWCDDDGVPFGTSAENMKVHVPAVDEGISFERHVRPMYKMFVKALFAREDRAAARKVLGILKEEEVRAMVMRQEQSQARTAGLAKKANSRGRGKQ